MCEAGRGEDATSDKLPSLTLSLRLCHIPHDPASLLSTSDSMSRKTVFGDCVTGQRKGGFSGGSPSLFSSLEINVQSAELTESAAVTSSSDTARVPAMNYALFEYAVFFVESN